MERTGARGAAAAAVLAACGTSNEAAPGESGGSPDDQEVTPTVPLEAATESEIRNNQTLLRTAASLELLAAESYNGWGPQLDAEGQADAARWEADHLAAAEEFNAALPSDLTVDEPNQVLLERFVQPLEPDLINAEATYGFFSVLESTLAATYVVAVGDYVPLGPDDDERTIFAEHASAAARRSTGTGNGGPGLQPDSALFDTVDLVPAEAYLTVDDPNAAPEDGASEGDDINDDPEANQIDGEIGSEE